MVGRKGWNERRKPLQLEVQLEVYLERTEITSPVSAASWIREGGSRGDLGEALLDLLQSAILQPLLLTYNPICDNLIVCLE